MADATPIEDIEDHGALSLTVLHELITTGRIGDTTRQLVCDRIEQYNDDNPRANPDDAVPDGSASVVLEWVDEDPDRARLALDVEADRDRPRKALSEQLDAIANPDDDDPDQEV